MNDRFTAIASEARERWEAARAGGREQINLCLDTSSLARGGAETLAALREAIAAKGLNADVTTTGSWGFCWLEPTLSVRSAAGTRTVLYHSVTPARVEEFVQTVLVEAGELPELALGVVEGAPSDQIAPLEDHPYMRGQVRRLMANCGQIDPENIDHALANGAYEGFVQALDMEAEAIIELMLESGLGGRGGRGASWSATPTRATPAPGSTASSWRATPTSSSRACSSPPSPRTPSRATSTFATSTPSPSSA